VPNFIFTGERDAKGRNGHFKPSYADFFRSKSDPNVSIGIWSKRTDGNPPIWLDLPPAEMANFGQFLIDNSQVKPSLNLWKARITTHDGESEYSDDVFIRGGTEEEALAEARYQARHWYGDADEEATPSYLGGDRWDEAGGYRIIELEFVQKVETLEELMSSLHIIECGSKVHIS
jgi:hypothetical protein